MINQGILFKKEFSQAGHSVYDRYIVKDDVVQIKTRLNKLIDNKDVDVVITTGGTGITGRDLTPEVFNEILEKEIPGFENYLDG